MVYAVDKILKRKVKMAKKSFNSASQSEEINREKIEKSLGVFLHNNSVFKDYAVTPYIAGDLKSFGLKAYTVCMAEIIVPEFSSRTGAKAIVVESDSFSVALVRTCDVKKKFFNAKKKEKFSVKIVNAVKRLRK